MHRLRYGAGRRRLELHVPGYARWGLPYAAIWAAVGVAISRATQQADCTGFCAVYAGWESYGVLFAGALLSTTVAVVQLWSLGR